MNKGKSIEKPFHVEWMEPCGNKENMLLKIKGKFKNSSGEICTISIDCKHDSNENTKILTRKIETCFKNFISEKNDKLPSYLSGEAIIPHEINNDIILLETNNKTKHASKGELSWTIKNTHLKNKNASEDQKDTSKIQITNELKSIIKKINASEKSTVIERIAQTIKSLFVLFFIHLQEAELALVSESTANGALRSVTRKLVSKAIPENCNIDPNVIDAYRNYAENKRPKNLDVLKQGECVFLDLHLKGFTGGHQITGMIRKNPNDTYSLTVANSGYGLDHHPRRQKDERYYTVITYKNIDAKKIEAFFKNPIQRSLLSNIKSECESLYKNIKDLNGELDIPNCHVDNAQLGGSCAGRQELLILKHVIPLNAYRQLKINLTERAVLSRAKIFHSTKMSTDKKILLLGLVRKLAKNYTKTQNTKMKTLVEATELKILESLKNPQKTFLQNKKFFGLIPQKKSSCNEYNIFISGLKALQAGDFINARRKLEEAFHFFKNKKSNFKLSNDEINVLKNISATFSNPKNSILATPEEWDLIGGAINILSFITNRIVKNEQSQNTEELDQLQNTFKKALSKFIGMMKLHSHIKDESIWCQKLKKKK